MGKSYRYDPEAEGRFEKGVGKKARKGKCAAKKKKVEEPVRSFTEGWDWKNNCIDKEWVVERMATRVRCAVDDLIRDELICEGEREDYIAKYNWMLLKYSEKYDPNRVGKDGRTASPLHYLRIVESGITSNIRDYALYRKKYFHGRALVQTPDEAKETPGSICVEDVKLSDGCKSVKELELRMDIQTLKEMLDEEEEIFLEMRLEGYTQDEIAVEIGKKTGVSCDRDHVRKVVMVHVQVKARKCGFFPPSEKR